MTVFPRSAGWPVEFGEVGDDFMYGRAAAKVRISEVTLELLLDATDRDGALAWVRECAEAVRAGADELTDDSFVVVRLGCGSSWAFLGGGQFVPGRLVEVLASVGDRRARLRELLEGRE